jgi:cyclase
MLAKRIIPCLDVKDGRVVKGIKFKKLKDAGDPVEQALSYDKQGADELTFLDITASVEKREIIQRLVRKVASHLTIPFAVGGGLRSIDDIRNILSAGADKVTLNTSAVNDPSLITESAKVFGSQCIVLSIDAKLRKSTQRSLKTDSIENKAWWEVYTHGGRTPTGIDAISWAKKAEKLGAGEILLTSMDCDGTQHGYNMKLTKAICNTVNVPVIASGGAGTPQHIYEILTKGNASAALAASIFHYGTYPIPKVKQYLKEKGVNVRL